MAAPALAIALSDHDRHELERLQRASAGPAGLSRRARAVLLMAAGLPETEVARRTGYTPVQVSRIRHRFAAEGLAGLADRPRSGRPPTVSARTRARVVALTLKAPPKGVSHWSTRELAREVGLSHATVHRIWQAHACSRTVAGPSSSPPTPRPRTRSATSSASPRSARERRGALRRREDADPGP